MLRNAPLRRAVASFFLLEVIGSLAAPSLSYALMGPGQPEFTSYESAGSPDMVNLSTGDMTYNVPVLEVPGPETSFSLPLTYRAGIRPEQEASWVGLGWGMNPGAIVRNVNGYPDDASGELATNSYSDPGKRGWYGGVPGILTLGWDSETGRSGTASLLGFVSASWSGGKLQSGDIVGIGATRGEGFTVDAVKVAGAMLSVATAGMGSAAAGALSTGAKVALQAGGAVIAGVGIAAFGKSGPSGGGFQRPTVVKDHTWFRTKYWVFVNDTTKEAMFGSLHFNNMSSNILRDYSDANGYGPNVYDGPGVYAEAMRRGDGKARKGFKFKYNRNFGTQGNFVTETAADMQQYTNPDYPDYQLNAQNPLSIVHDDFSVMGPGISGAIRPQRLDVGSLAYPRQMSDRHDKYCLVPWTDYKVPFRYDNSGSNTYTYNANTNPDNASAGIDGAHWNKSHLVITDPKLYDVTPNADIPPNPAAVRTEPNRKGLTDKRLVQGKQVDWFTNKEIADAYDNSPTKYLIAEHRPDVSGQQNYQVLDGYNEIPGSEDVPSVFEPIYVTKTLTSNNIFRRLRPEDGIGAFAITAEDGTVYHYSLPVYHFRQYAKTLQNLSDDPKKGVAINRTGARGTDVFNFATAWLLTAITSPDYVDRGVIGVVDDQDLGTWVTFSYGKFAKQFKWRQPYVGTEASPPPASPDARTFQEGAKETYYLNAIRTRTHSALFVKSVRQDGRGHYTSGTTTTDAAQAASNLGIDERTPSSSLRLDEIIVINNQDLTDIQTRTGFGEDTQDNAAAKNGTLGGQDSFAGVLDQNDISANSAIRPALNQKALKRVVFNYSYRLCVGAPNSFTSATAPPALGSTYSATGRKGKLTLESIATYGPNSVKLIPDFKFEYGPNPTYDPNKWDGFGMYASNATATTTSHRPATDFATATRDGAAWSLTKITNPLGATTEITYERDQYASVSEFGNDTYLLVDQGTDSPNGLLVGDNSFDLTSVYRPKDVIHLKGTSWQNYQIIAQPIDQNGYPNDREEVSTGPCNSTFEEVRTIAEVTPHTIRLDAPLPAPDNSANHCIPANDRYRTYQGSDLGYGGTNATVRIPANRIGGDIRVAAVTTRDEENQAYTIKYKYTSDVIAPRNSSGVLSKEPEYIKSPYEAYPFYALFDYPATPVMYGRATVLRGNFTTPDDIDQREEYTFHTAHSSMVQVATTKANTTAKYPFLSRSGDVGLRQQNNTVAVDIGLLGQAKSIRKYNRRGTLEFSTVFNYTTSLPNADGIASQGTFTESALTSEFTGVDTEHETNKAFYNLNWTTKRYLPTTLLGTTTTTNNVAATTTNKLYDFYTGAVLETALTNSLGDKYRSQTVPAYTRYPGMGPKTEAAGNRHMLTQVAATYAYKENGTTSPSVLQAGIQTWNNSWSYRRYDATSDRYQTDPAAQAPIWRQHRTYAWQSPRLNPDGTYANFVAYNWSQPTQTANWLNVGEVTLYDHYSRPLESKDLNGQYSTQKTGHEQSLTLAAAGNARYTEIAYSGAEDRLTTGSAPHFGGEVRDGGRQSRGQAHTGQFSSLLTATSPRGFTYQALVGNANDLSTGRTYRASVWVHESDADGSARLYSTLNGVTTEVSRLTAPVRRAGKWYLLSLNIDLPATATGQQLTVGCRRTGTSDVYVDDFRFQPLDAPLQASVYDPVTRLLTYSLDNDNFFTHYEYDAAGKVVKVSKEVLTPAGSTAPAERVVQESAYNYARMQEPNWVRTSLVECEPGPDGSPTGYRRYQRQDTNSASPTYNQFDWERGEYTAECPPCTGNLVKWVGGKCEYPRRLECVSTQFYYYAANCTPMYRNSYKFKYSDETTVVGEVVETYPCATPSNSKPSCP